MGKERKLEIRPIIHTTVSFRTPRRHRMRGGGDPPGQRGLFLLLWKSKNHPWVPALWHYTSLRRKSVRLGML